MAKQEDRSTEIFERMSVKKAMWTLCLPNIASMLTSIVYNLVDIYFIGQTGDPNQVAAVSLCGPIFTILMGLGNVFGIGGGTYLSRTLGEGRKDRVKKITSFCFWTALVVGLLMAVLIMSFMHPLLKVLGTSQGTQVYCQQYMTWIGLGAPFVIMHFTTSNLIRSEGGAKETMIGTMIGTITNIILDPVMIFGLNLGVAGAAAATIIGHVFSNIYYLWYILGKSKSLSLAPKHYSASWKEIVGPLLVVGVPASLNNLMGSIASVLLNNEMIRYGENAIAGFGVAGKVNSMAVMVLIAIAFGVQPLLGYCYGAANKERFMAGLKYTIKCQVLIGTIGMLIIEIFAAPLIRFFIADAEVIKYGEFILRIMSLSCPIIGVMMLLTNLFQSMGKALPSMVLSLSRQGFVYIPVLLILSRVAGYHGVVCSQATADVLALILALVFYVRVMKKDKKFAK